MHDVDRILLRSEEALTLLYLSTTGIRLNPQQPRLIANDKSLAALVDSIKIFGVLVPVQVHKHEDNQYSLVAGHRRLAAAKIVGLEKIPARVLSSQKTNSLEVALAENMLRDNLDTIEVAMALSTMSDRGLIVKNSVRYGKDYQSVSFRDNALIFPDCHQFQSRNPA